MSVIVFLESWKGKFKRNTWEAAYYAAKTANMMGTETIGVAFGKLEDNASISGKYGVNKVISLGKDFNQYDNYKYAHALQKVATENGSNTYIISGTFNGKAIAPLLAVMESAGLITNVTKFPSHVSPLTVTRSVFSSKGFVDYITEADKRIIVFVPNSTGLEESEGTAAEVINGSVSSGYYPSVEVKEVNRVKGKIPLPEAERVVSGGRGMKGPENWDMLEKLAEVLNAGTACSKPVSDMGWRPHTEHVGQTGISISPNLYIAIGISGAIQHLAGVSNSKTIVAINNNPEAPFFKAADYGIVGDAFEVVPRLTEAIQNFKADN